MKKAIQLCFSLVIASIFLTSCNTSSVTLSNGVDLSQYKRIVFGGESHGDAELTDLILQVENIIRTTKLEWIFPEEAYATYQKGDILTSQVLVSSQWGVDFGTTTVSVVFYDFKTNQRVAVIKADNTNLAPFNDSKGALEELQKKLQEIFGKR